MSVNQKLKEYILNKGIKQSFISAKTGIELSKISKIMNGKRTVTAIELKQIADALNVDANIFLQ